MGANAAKGKYSTNQYPWIPLPLGYVLERHGLTHRGTLYVLGLWILLFVVSVATVITIAPSLQSKMAPHDFELISIFATAYPPLILSTLFLFWFGFEWGFIPAYLSTFLIALASGMDVWWALLFGIAVVLGLAIYALTYFSIKVEYSLRSLSSFAVFVGVSFIASMASSLGSLLWCHIHELSLESTLTIWKAWWTGSFLQTLVIIAPILFVASPYVERWKNRHFSPPDRPELSLTWIYVSIIAVVSILCLFVWANELLGSLRMQEAINNFPNTSKEAIISATQSFELTTWIAMAMAVAAGLGGIKLVGTWNSSLKDQVRQRTKLLNERVQQFRATFEQAAVGVTHTSMDGEFLKVNQKMAELTKYSTDELQQKTYQELTHPDDLQKDIEHLRKLKRGEIDHFMREKRYQAKEGQTIWINVSTSLVRDDKEKPWYFISVIEDISDRKEYEQRIKKSLDKKETLLAEIHHRVKNNLAVVSAILELQAKTTDNIHTRDLLENAITRIQSMAMVHRLLYESEAMDNINLQEYIQQLGETIQNTFTDEDKEINLQTDLSPIELDIDQAVPCGLIVNELIVNAYKHAFEGRDEGNIYVQLTQESDNKVLLQVSDDGKGIPEDMDPSTMNSLGMKLIQTLSRQLHADLETKNEGGAVFNLRFTPEKA